MVAVRQTAVVMTQAKTPATNNVARRFAHVAWLSVTGYRVVSNCSVGEHINDWFKIASGSPPFTMEA